MDMVNAISKLVDKLHIINALITQMAGVVVETEGRMVINRFQSTFCGGNVKGDFRGMNLQTILDGKKLNARQMKTVNASSPTKIMTVPKINSMGLGA